GLVSVKGFREPIELHEIVRIRTARTRVHAAARRALTRFVGRTTELQRLERTLEEAHVERGRVMAIIGKPGVGKSRLLHELIQSTSAQCWRVLGTGGVPYGAGTSYLPIIALLKRYLRIDDRVTPHAVAETLRRTVLNLDRALETDLPALAILLDAPIDNRE